MSKVAQPQRQESIGREEGGAVWVAVLVLTLLALAVRFWRLGATSFWLDEAASWWFSRYPAVDLLTRNVDPGNPPLYYLALRGWVSLFGDSETALRAVSALAGGLAVPVIYLLGRDLFGRRVGVLAAFLLTVSPIHLFYSQEARQYAPVLLFGLLSAWLFLRATRMDRWSDWLGAALFAAVAFYVHYSALLIPAFEGTYALLAARRRRALAAAGFYAILCLPGAVLFLAPTFFAQAGYQFWQGYVTPAALVKMANKLFGKPVGAEDPRLLQAAFAALLPAALLYPLWHAGRALWREEADQERPILFAFLYLVVPMALFIALARVKPVWQERYLLVALPGYLLVTAWALAHLKGVGRGIVAGSLAVLTIAGIAGSGQRWRKEDWRDAVGAIQAAAASTGETDVQVFLTMPFITHPFDYYSRGNLPLVGYPGLKRPLGPQDGAEVKVLAERAARTGTVFVVHGQSGDGDPGLMLERRLAALRGPGTFRRYLGMRVFAFGKGAPALGGIPVTQRSLAAEDGRYR